MIKEVGFDFGSSTVYLADADKGVIESFPNCVLVNRDSGKIEKYWDDAIKHHNNFPAEYKLERPLKGGISEKNIHLLPDLIKNALAGVCGTQHFPRRAVFAVSSAMTKDCERSLTVNATGLGIREVYTVNSVLCALLAHGYDSASSYIVVDIGASATEIMLICRGDIKYSHVIPCGGDEFDEAIINYVYEKHGTKMSERTAQDIKTKIGTVWDDGEPPKPLRVKLKKFDGTSPIISITSKEMFTALEEPTSKIVEEVCTAISRIPTNCVNDVFTHGVLLSGGGANLTGLVKLIKGVTGVNARIMQNNNEAVALGLSEVLRLLPSGIPSSCHNLTKFVLKSMGFSAG